MSCSLLPSFLIINSVFGESSGLTIKLVRRDSPESPFYQSNLTYPQRIEQLFNQSRARLKQLSNFPSNLRSKIFVEDAVIFSTQIGLGSFRGTSESFKSYHFVVDTGSPLTWVECQDCKLPNNHCFRPTSEPFLDASSTSFERIFCPPRGQPHPLCNPRDCIGEFCGYNLRYADNSTSKGYLAHETFTFEATTRPHMKERVSRLVFGCGFDITNMPYSDTSKISGLLGLGWGASSFVTQLGPKSNGKFSYCLPRITQQNISSFLHFGNNIPRTRVVHRTPLRQYGNKATYFLNLTGISVSRKPLNLTVHDFARKPNNTGGCSIDSGSAVSHIVNFAFEKVKEGLIEYMSNVHGFVRVQVHGYDLCYKRTGPRQGFRNLPTITFHFQGADLRLEPSNIFLMSLLDGKEAFCLGMLSNNRASRVTIIGAYQQTNIRFVYLTHENMLEFGPENCTANA